MITANCTHPPYMVITTDQLSMAAFENIAERIHQAGKGVVPHPTLLAAEGVMRVEILECSWCRNPDAPVVEPAEA